MTTKYRACGPSGKRIIGTLEQIQGCAFAEFHELDDDGEIRPEYEGKTKIYWDSQVSVIREDQLVFLDEASNEWLQSQVTFVPVEPEPDAPGDSATDPCACPSCRSSDIHFVNRHPSLQGETGVALDLNEYQCRSCNFTFFV